ncbi:MULTISPECIES: helix-turn-helix transcriptional regulator [Paenibacillus]|uniref:Helix-turn-helix domain-containing protein n=2 Tax=Paenibacillus TaxID=44249 RepID=A0ABT4DVJ5_9BACL|nr:MULTISPECIES: helix-turn-helix transcriptional regulator [Paenibacillus]MCE5168499.1 helix-turn-helix domain-containing protein [Paenibacillus profundus]MCY9513263.1 helix-turn-helix domain-containing protein [Paenibacillus apiarius]MCY9521378.1 helix-turn-helix domain-containing protein [Paenibacillus apiarius]MCY9554476.1 helix-turn-helix domain-containing protein [Paenibacillus apiarius]MCY9560679.1 helix-turn-helix domain-containing protein [Paenibacillus apiarius]
MKILVKDFKLLNKLLVLNGFSKRSFGIALDVSSTTMSQICNGKRNPSPRIAKLICEELKVAFDDVFEVVTE